MVDLHCLKLELCVKLTVISSLKEKRSISKSLMNFLKKKHNISIIEHNNNDSKKFLCFLISAVSSERDYLLSLIENLEIDINIFTGFEVISEEYDIF